MGKKGRKTDNSKAAKVNGAKSDAVKAVKPGKSNYNSLVSQGTNENGHEFNKKQSNALRHDTKNAVKAVKPEKKDASYFCKEVFRFLVIFCAALMVMAPLCGTLTEFAGISWNGIVLSAIVVLSLACTVVVLKLSEAFKIDNLQDIGFIVVIIAVTIIIYGNYSTILELRQDPSLYIFKALNLVNGGHQYKSFETLAKLCEAGVLDRSGEYASYFNGTKFLNENLYTDFFPGGTFIYACFGLISKSIIFWGQTFIMIVNGVLMFFLMKKITRNSIFSFLLTGTFLFAPLIVWFGRGSFSEPSALFFLLLIANLLYDKKMPAAVIAVVFLSSYTSRIDYWLLLILGAVIITYKNKIIGAVYTAFAIGEIVLMSKVYNIYYERIVLNDMKILKYDKLILAAVFAVVFVFLLIFKDKVEDIYRSKVVFVIMCLAVLFIAARMYANNIITPEDYETAEIHGKVLRTYSEEIWDLLFLVFPSVVLLPGFLAIPKLAKDKDVDFLPSFFIVASGMIYSVYLISAGNSPQLYWMLRRYCYAFVPVCALSFANLVKKGEKKLISFVLAGICLLSLNMFLDTHQLPDYNGMEQGVKTIEDSLSERKIKTVLVDMSSPYAVSSLVSYADLDFVPFYSEEELAKILKSGLLDEESTVYLGAAIEGANESMTHSYSYITMGESYGVVPKENYSHTYTFHEYSIKELKNTLADFS